MFAGKTVLVFLILALSLATISDARLSSETLDISPSSITSCARSLTLRDVSLKVTNTGGETDTFEFTMDAPTGWEGTIQRDIVLASGESRFLDLFLINMPLPWTVPSGRYDVRVTVRSLRFPTETLTKTLSVEILPCFSVDLVPLSPQPLALCQENRTPTVMDFALKNTGRTSQSFVLSSTVSWAVPSQTSVTLAAGESRPLTLTILPPETVIGRQNIALTVRATESGVSDTEQVVLTLADCYHLEAFLQPTEATGCLGTTTNYSLVISNTGTVSDTLDMSTPSWVKVSPSSVTVASGQTKTIPVTVAPDQTGRLPFNVTITSQKSSQNTRIASAVVAANDCRGVLVSSPTTSASVCTGSPALFDIVIKNTGVVANTYSLTTDAGQLSASTLTVPAGASQTVRLNLTNNRESKRITVRATDGTVSGNVTLDLQTRTCYSVAAVISPDETSACSGQQKSFVLFVKNTGEIKDTYRVTIDSNTTDVTLNPGEAKPISYTHTVSGSANQTVLIEATAFSAKSSANSTASIAILDRATCYTIDLQTPEPVSVSLYKAAAYPFKIRNAGQNPDSYFIRVVGPTWVFTSPKAINLDPGAEAIGYIYAQPDTTVETGVYSFDVEVASANARATQRVIVTVSAVEVSDNQTLPDVVMQPVQGGDNATAAPQDGDQNVTIVVGQGDERNTSGATGLPPLTSASAKFWVLVAVVLIVIVILVARVALWVK